jgi:radical SAM protein with 4Fe4S-binding SPASM domain
MSIKLIEKILEELSGWEKPLREICPANFGEFLLLENWFEILKLIEEKLPKTRIAFATNGYFLGEDAVHKLVSVKTLGWLNFSVNAYFRETYEQIMGLSAETIAKVKQAAKLIRELRPDIKTCASIVFDTAHVTEAEKQIFVAFWKPLVSVVSVNPTNSCNIPFKKPLFTNKLPCRSIFTDLVVGYDGKIATCCYDANFELDLGYYGEDGTILEIWNGPKFTKLRQTHLEGRRTEIEICKNCTFA